MVNKKLIMKERKEHRYLSILFNLSNELEKIDIKLYQLIEDNNGIAIQLRLKSSDGAIYQRVDLCSYEPYVKNLLSEIDDAICKKLFKDRAKIITEIDSHINKYNKSLIEDFYNFYAK